MSCTKSGPRPAGFPPVFAHPHFDPGRRVVRHRLHDVVPHLLNPADTSPAMLQHLDRPNLHGDLRPRLDRPSGGGLRNPLHIPPPGRVTPQQVGHDLCEVTPGTGIGAGREIRPAKLTGTGHERIRGVEIDFLEYIRTPESHLVPHGTRQPLVAGGHHLIQQPHGTRITHAPGHRVGKIGIKPLRQAFYQLRFHHTGILPPNPRF